MKHVAAYLLVRIISSVSSTASLWLRSVRAFFFRCAPRAPPRAGARVRVCSVVIGGAPGGREGEHGRVLCRSLGGRVRAPVWTPAVPGTPLPPSGG